MYPYIYIIYTSGQVFFQKYGKNVYFWHNLVILFYIKTKCHDWNGDFEDDFLFLRFVVFFCFIGLFVQLQRFFSIFIQSNFITWPPLFSFWKKISPYNRYYKYFIKPPWAKNGGFLIFYIPLCIYISSNTVIKIPLCFRMGNSASRNYIIQQNKKTI